MKPSTAASALPSAHFRLPPAVASGLAIATWFILLACWAWARTPDLFLDFGQQLYIAWRLTEGDRLYLDIAYFNGPFSPWFNALTFRLFGTGLHTLYAINLVILALITLLMLQLLRRWASRFASTLAVCMFLAICGFAHLIAVGNYNYLTPYAHELTHGMAFALLAFSALHRWTQTSQRSLLVCAALAAGFATLTKSELALPLLIGLAASFFSRVLLLKRGEGLRSSAIALGVLFVPIALAWFRQSRFAPAPDALAQVLSSWRALVNPRLSALYFFRAGMGLDAPLSNLLRLLRVSLLWIAALLPIALLAWRRPHRSHVETALALAVAFAGAVVLSFFSRAALWLGMMRPLPLVAGAFILYALHRRRDIIRQPHSAQPATHLLLGFSCFALALLGKIILNARLRDYGFVLAMPAFLLLVVAIMDGLPRFLARRGGSFRVARAGAVAVCAMFTLFHLRISQSWYREKTLAVDPPLVQPADTFLADQEGLTLGFVLNELHKRMAPGETLAVVPDGSMLNYLLRRVNPTGFTTLMPTEFALYGAAAIEAGFAQSPPDWIVLVGLDTSDFGVRFFGRDYARQLMRWIEWHYETVQVIGVEPFVNDRIGIRLMRSRRQEHAEF